MLSQMPPSAAIQVVRPIRTAGPHPTFVAQAGVQFYVPAGPVRAVIKGVDRDARPDLPHGAPYRLTVRAAPAGCGYEVGRDYTIRAACLELDPEAAQPSPATTASIVPTVSVPPMFLVAFMREGGTAPVQGTVLVAADTLEAASAAAMAQLTAELEADVRERGESPEAMVLLLNAAEVSPPRPGDGGPQVIAAVTW
jgi:hypothetical protein